MNAGAFSWSKVPGGSCAHGFHFHAGRELVTQQVQRGKPEHPRQPQRAGGAADDRSRGEHERNRAVAFGDSLEAIPIGRRNRAHLTLRAHHQVEHHQRQIIVPAEQIRGFDRLFGSVAAHPQQGRKLSIG